MRTQRRFVPAACASLLWACTAGDPEPDGEPAPLTAEEQAAAWAAPGPNPVGYRTWTITWSPPELDEPRDLRLAVWYPASESDGDEPEYLRDGTLPPVWVDAPAAPAARPLAVYSHGHQAFAEASSFLSQHLASHGWVVVAPDHTGNTVFDGPGRVNDIYFLRPRDLSAILDNFGRLPSTDPLSGVDVTHTAAFGHSFGGYTTFAIAGAAYDMPSLEAGCEMDPGDPFCQGFDADRALLFSSGFRDHRVTASVAMAPGDSGKFTGGLGDREIPTLLLTGQDDGSTTEDPSQDPFWTGMNATGDQHLRLLGAGHNAFTDLASTALDDAARKAEVWAAIRVATLAHLSEHQGGLVSPPDASNADILATIPTTAAIQVAR